MSIDQKKLRLAAYLRVSTKKQEQENTIENQRRAISEYLKYNRNLEMIEEFADDGISAFKDRPKFNELMSRIDDFDGIIIAKLSRIGRSTRQLLEIVDNFKKKKKQLVVVGDKIDTSTPLGEFFFTVLAAFNQYEASLIKERMNEGLKRYISEGGKLGRVRKRLEDITDGKPPTDKQLKEYYIKFGFGLNKLSKLYKVSRNTMKTKLIEIGIVIRKPKGVK
jgi:DNA invertase Pin-like site-specific DNA recombinase